MYVDKFVICQCNLFLSSNYKYLKVSIQRPPNSQTVKHPKVSDLFILGNNLTIVLINASH